MNFTTTIPISKSSNPIDYDSRIISLGSCFAQNIGEKFSYFKFQNTVNPFGIIFNPVSIENLIFRVVNNQLFTENDIFSHNGLWHCFEVHSELSHSDKTIFLDGLNQIFDKYDTKGTWYAHASVGCLHVRPVLNMKLQTDVSKMRNIADETSKLVKKFKGSYSGEHGDGIARSEFNEVMFGKKMINILIRLNKSTIIGL